MRASFFELILMILWWPYETWKNSNDSSRVGVSEWNQNTARFWKRFAWVTSVLLVVSGVVIHRFFPMLF